MGAANTAAMPSAVVVNINGGTLTLPSAVAKSTGNTWYHGEIRKGLRFEGSPEAALNTLKMSIGDVALKAGKVHVSEPQRDKTGKIKEGTGGNLTVAHSSAVAVNDGDGKPRKFTAMVNVTYLGEEKGYSLYAKLINQRVVPVVVGEVSGLVLA